MNVNKKTGKNYNDEKIPNECEDDQWTPLHIACFWDHLPIVQYLIEREQILKQKMKISKLLFIRLHILV